MSKSDSILIERKALLNEICSGILQGKYYSILGPKLIGKTTFLKQIKSRIEGEHESFKCVYIDLGELKTADSHFFYSDFVQKISDALNVKPSKKVESIKEFDDFLTSLIKSSQENITLLLDEIEHIPEYITNDLLGLFRVFHQARKRETFYKKISIIISGSTNLLEFTLGKTISPFNIAHPILLSDLDDNDGNELIEKIMSQAQIQVTPPAKKEILVQTNGHPYLISRICFLCTQKTGDGVVGESIVKESIQQLVMNYKEDEFFNFIIDKVENDLDTFETLIETLDRGYSTQKEIEITIGKYELSGAFLKKGKRFRIRNHVIEKLLSEHFDTLRKGDVFIILGRWTKALQLYQSMEHSVRVKKRREKPLAIRRIRTIDIIKAIGNLMYYPEQSIDTIFEYLLDGIYYALSYDSVYLYSVNKEKNSLQLKDSRGINKAPKVIKIEKYSQILEVRAYNAQKYVVEDKNEQNNFAVAFPLQLREGVVKWILSINNHTSRFQIKKFDCEELKIFANEALLAIRNARSYYHLYKDKQAILEAMGEELSIIDSDYNILYMNREKAVRIGKDYSETGEKCYKIFARRDSPCPNCPCIEAMKTGEIVRRSRYHTEYHKDNKAHFVFQTASPLKDFDGNCFRAVKVVRDVTKQKKLFEIIEKLQQESNLSRLISIIMDGIVELGYKRARFYDFIVEKSDGSVIGRVSRGMGDFQNKFRGYRIDLKEVKYLDATLKGKEPQFYFGDVNKPALKDKKWLKDLGLENVKWMDLPLISGKDKELMGIIAIDNKSKGEEFTDEDLNVMAILAGYAAQAIENSRYISRQKILYDISKVLSRTLKIEELQKNIVKTICEIIRTELCSILLFDEKRDLLIMRNTYLNTKDGWTHKIDFEEKYEIDTYICGRVYKEGKPKIINNIPTYRPKHEFFIDQYEKLLKSGKVMNAIFAPLTYKNDKIGILRASNKLDERNRLSDIGFKKEDLDVLVSLGEQIAIALANSKLYENQKRSIKQLEMLTDISNFIQKENNLNKILYLILTGLTIQGGMDFNRAILFLADKKKMKLKGEMALAPANEQETLKNWGQLTRKNFEEIKNTQQILKWIAEDYDQHEKELLGTELNKKYKKLTFKRSEENVLMEAFREKKTISCTNKELKPGDPFLKAMAPGIWAITPLILDENPIGAIYVDNKHYSHKITDQQIEILKLFANQAAIAIHNSELDKEKTLQLKGLTALNEVISMITSALDLEEIYRAIEGTKNIFSSIDEMCLLIKKEENDDYIPVIYCPKKNTPECENCKSQERECIKKEDSFISYYCPNIEEDPYFKKAIKKDLKSRFIIPLVFKKKLLGIFDIGGKTIDAFSEFDQKLFRSLGSQIAIAINNRIKQDKQVEIFEDISHSLGTYLTTMRGYTQRLIEGKVNTQFKKDEYLRRLFVDILSLNNSVDEISSLATMEHGEMNFAMEKVGVNDIIESMARKNEFPLNEKNLDLEISPADEKISVNADRKKLEEALQSLMNNAIKFSEKGKKIHISALTELNHVLIKIKDQGIGIHKDDFDRIFRKYERGRNVKEKVIEGTGIGLATTKNIIEKHSGEIFVESELDKGSIFTIKLPLFKKEDGK